MDISVITVTWNSEKFIADQIRSVENACQKISYEHFIVDNGSSDKTVEIIEKNFPQVKLIKSDKNLGFTKANNLAAKKVSGKYFLFLNPDMRLESGSLDILFSWMEQRSDVGICGPKLVSEDGEMRNIHKPVRFPTLTSLALSALKIPVLFPKILDKYTYSEAELKKDLEVDTVRGSCLLMRKEIFDKMGFAFDERYFFWFEDVDICRETKKLGLKVMFTPIISCVDFVGQSFKKLDWLNRQKRFYNSAIIYLKKWEPRYQSIILWILHWPGLLIIWIYQKMSGNKFKNAIER
jgi:GT2 family glycosyltransferase